MTEIEKLEQEIAEKKAKLNQLLQDEQTRTEGIVMPARLFTPEEKIKKFDDLNAHVLNIIDCVREQSFMDEDEKHYLYEHAMGFVTRDTTKFWKYFNSLLKR